MLLVLDDTEVYEVTAYDAQNNVVKIKNVHMCFLARASTSQANLTP